MVRPHELDDSLAAAASGGSDVLDRPAEADIVSHKVISTRRGPQLFNIRLLDFVVT